MIRAALLFSILAAPAVAQTALSERPGRWISIQRTETPVVEAPVVDAPVAEAPVVEAPVVEAPVVEVADPAPERIEPSPSPSLSIVATVPEAAEALILVTPQRVVPDTRPVPRPRVPVVEVAAVVPDIVEVIEEVLAEIVVEVAPEPEPVARVAAPLEVASPVEVVAPVEPVEVAAVVAPPMPSTRPVPRPETEDTVALAEALAAEIAAEAFTIMVAAPRDVPVIDTIAPEDALAPVQVVVIPEVAAPAPTPVPVVAPVQVATAPSVVPRLVAALETSAREASPVSMSAVLLPARVTGSPPIAQPVAFVMPPLETAPILPRQRPRGPAAMEGIAPLNATHAATVSAVLLPSPAAQFTPAPTFARSVAPSYDLFPQSALPPGDLPEGPYSMRRAIQPPHPFAEANAAVLTGQPTVIPARLPVFQAPETPAFETPITDPDAPVELPAPDASAVARMMDDAMICWDLASLSPEAHWARVSVDVALDETNMPSAGSIRLTGFAHVVSGAAEEAYRAANAALMGCAEATDREPVTTSATLIFDRSGVRLQ